MPDNSSGSLTAAEVHEQQQTQQQLQPQQAQPVAPTAEPVVVIGETSQYAPYRLRHTRKEPERMFMIPAARPDPALSRLPESLPEDLPELMEDLGSHPMTDRADSSPRNVAAKRGASHSPEASPTRRQRLHSTDLTAEDELLCQATDSWAPIAQTVDCYMASFLQKKAQKELPVSGNDPTLQKEIEAAKAVEWQTLLGKNAFQVWTGKKAEQIKQNHPDRFIGSRFVVVEKFEENNRRVKARLCLQVFKDTVILTFNRRSPQVRVTVPHSAS